MTPEAFRAGDRVMLRDERGRAFMIRLEPGATFHYHGGAVPHDLVIGSDEGTTVHSTTGTGLTCFRPRLADFVLKMGRGAQVIYPKDLGAILVYGDVFPGARVLEAGTGSGALTLMLCRAVGPEGAVVSYEVRDEFRRVATGNIEAFLGKLPPFLDLRAGDVRDVASTGEMFERALLDLPDPSAVLVEIDAALVAGGILTTYLPTTGQVQQTALALERAGYVDVETFEVMLRTWHVAPRSVRPDHRMVAHTGFVTVGRKPARTDTAPGDVSR